MSAGPKPNPKPATVPASYPQNPAKQPALIVSDTIMPTNTKPSTSIPPMTEYPPVLIDGTPSSAFAASPTPGYPAPFFTLDENQVQRLSSLLGANIQSPEQLVTRVAKLTTISVNGCEITLSEGLLNRMKSRALKQWGNDWIKSTVTRLIANEMGW